MKHIHIDEFAKLDSPIHMLHPRAKVSAIFIFIFITVIMTNPLLLSASVFFWTGMILTAKIPLGHVFRRITWIVPFAGFLIILFPFITPGDVVWTWKAGFISIAATAQGIDRAVMLLLRALASVLALILLMTTTRFGVLLKALNDLKVPGVIIQMVEFTIRYIFVTVDELKRMRRARKSRGFELARNIWHLHTLKTLAQMVGTMFIRAYERGDRVYVAMMSRGFTGRIKTVNEASISLKDYIIAGGILLVAIILLVLDKGGFIG